MISINVCKRILTSDGPITLSVDLNIKSQEFFSFFGHSGAGKTMTLRMLAGLTVPDSGEINVDGNLWFHSGRKINLPIQKRNIGFVFQDYALFPSMTVRKNLEFAAGKNNKIIKETIEIMGLGAFEHTLPSKLSGGQRQKVALARALVRCPQILLLDEPLSAIDCSMRNLLQDEICRVHSRFKLTSIIVSHDIAEILKLSNRVAIFNCGSIVKTGNPEDIFSQNLSSRIKVTGKIINIKISEIAAVITVHTEHFKTKVIIDINEACKYVVGQKVIVAAEAVLPTLIPLE